jgi:hypothetical protein
VVVLIEAGTQLNRSFELSLSACKILVVVEKNICQRGMSFPQVRVKRQSFRRSLSKKSAAEKWPPCSMRCLSR